MRRRLTPSVGRGASIGSPRSGVAGTGIESLEASDGAIECTDVSKRSSYKELFLVCLVDRELWCPCRPPRFLGFLFISKAKNHRTTSIYIRKSEKGETKRDDVQMKNASLNPPKR